MTLAKEQDYTGLIVGCVCVSLLLLLLGTVLMWRKNKHIDGKGRDVGVRSSQRVTGRCAPDLTWICVIVTVVDVRDVLHLFELFDYDCGSLVSM